MGSKWVIPNATAELEAPNSIYPDEIDISAWHHHKLRLSSRAGPDLTNVRLDLGGGKVLVLKQVRIRQLVLEGELLPVFDENGNAVPYEVEQEVKPDITLGGLHGL